MMESPFIDYPVLERKSIDHLLAYEDLLWMLETLEKNVYRPTKIYIPGDVLSVLVDALGDGHPAMKDLGKARLRGAEVFNAVEDGVNGFLPKNRIVGISDNGELALVILDLSEEVMTEVKRRVKEKDEKLKKEFLRGKE